MLQEIFLTLTIVGQKQQISTFTIVKMIALHLDIKHFDDGCSVRNINQRFKEVSLSVTGRPGTEATHYIGAQSLRNMCPDILIQPITNTDRFRFRDQCKQFIFICRNSAWRQDILISELFVISSTMSSLFILWHQGLGCICLHISTFTIPFHFPSPG